MRDSYSPFGKKADILFAGGTRRVFSGGPGSPGGDGPEGRLKRLEHEYAASLQRQRELELELERLKHSASWRLTAPLRGILSRLHHAAPQAEAQAPAPAPQVPFHVLVPAGEGGPALRAALASLTGQKGGPLTATVFVPSVQAARTAEFAGFVEELRDNRVRLLPASDAVDFAAKTGPDTEEHAAPWLLLLAPGARLAPGALETLARAAASGKADALYGDEWSGDPHRPDARLLPAWSPDLIYAGVYLRGLLAVRAGKVEKAALAAALGSAAPVYTLALGLWETGTPPRHLPEALSTAPEPGVVARTDALTVLNRHLVRRYGAGARANSMPGGLFDTRFPLPEGTKVSIILPTKDGAALCEACVRSIEEFSTFRNFEILVLDNNSAEPETFGWFEQARARWNNLRVVPARFPFNWSQLNNFGMEQAAGDVFIFLNNDTIVRTPDWMERLAENALRGDIGAVGPMLLYEDGTIQHAGVALGLSGWADHLYKGAQAGTPDGLFIGPGVPRDVLAVTGACMAVSRAAVHKIGPFDERFVVCGSDIEFCLRAHEKGFFNLYDAHVRLSHLESKTRDSRVPDVDYILSARCYAPYLTGGDPFFHEKLDRYQPIPTERG